MYKLIVRPLFFLLRPESAHYTAMFLLSWASRFSLSKKLLRHFYLLQSEQLEKKVMGLTFRNPVGLAAGFDKNALWIDALSNIGFGFIEIGTVTPEAQSGNSKPRLFRLKADQALINRMGFNNLGAKAIVQKLKKRKSDIIVGGNIGKNTLTPNDQAVEDYISCYRALFDFVDYFTVNVSCPNIKGMEALQDKNFMLGLLKELKLINRNNNVDKPILLKVSPELNKSQMDEIIEIIEESEIEGLVTANTSSLRENLSTSQAKLLHIGSGGLSGLPIKDKSTQMIKYFRAQSKNKFTIIAVGGIHSPEDALEKLDAGADLIQVYTGFIYEGPSIVRNINQMIEMQQIKDS